MTPEAVGGEWGFRFNGGKDWFLSAIFGVGEVGEMKRTERWSDQLNPEQITARQELIQAGIARGRRNARIELGIATAVLTGVLAVGAYFWLTEQLGVSADVNPQNNVPRVTAPAPAEAVEVYTATATITATHTPTPSPTWTPMPTPSPTLEFTPTPEIGHIENGIRYTEPIELAPGAFAELGTVASTPDKPSLYDNHVELGSRFTPQLWESLRLSSFPQFKTNQELIDHLQKNGYIANIDIPYPLGTIDFDKPESFVIGWKTLEQVDLSKIKVLIYDTPNWDQAPLFTQRDKLLGGPNGRSVSLSKDPSTGGLVIAIFESGLTGDKDHDGYYFAPGVIAYRGYLVPRESLARIFKTMQIRHTVSGGEQYAWAAVTASGYGRYASYFNSISAFSSLLLIGN